jgi:CxxC motif-containing protein (DUF1111 family)
MPNTALPHLPAIVTLALLAQHGMAQELQDVHLNTLPRTTEEAARIAAVTAPPRDFTAPQQFEALSAGKATVHTHSDQAFKQPQANIGDLALDFALGEAMFDKLWVSSPSSTRASDGLGPLYNTRACRVCHAGGGRGHAPDGPDDDAQSLVLRLALPDGRPDPTYGAQMQDFAISGHVAEGRVRVDWQEYDVPLNGEAPTRLRRPTWSVADPAFGPPHPDMTVSPRVAPQMIGLGLLEAIPSADILALADPEDTDGDGISGRASVVWSVEHDQPMLGRFGLKASTPTLREQTAAAFSGDIGISTPLFPAAWGDCTAAQAGCRTAPHGDGDARVHEVDDIGLDLTTLYSRNLGVPARRDVDDPEVLRGKELFHAAGCAACHRPAYVTHRLADQPQQSFQLIWPYTDMLLHDMGPELADMGPDGAEWRTPPLWGIGLTKAVSGHSQFLHDGRARSLLEAVLWHGGEARAARDTVTRMPAPDRAALIRFLESL